MLPEETSWGTEEDLAVYAILVLSVQQWLSTEPRSAHQITAYDVLLWWSRGDGMAEA
jgi:hypothetical protein